MLVFTNRRLQPVDTRRMQCGVLTPFVDLKDKV